jgi:mannose/fructose/N-acetylgalactosamine-specific phosphotransferase system component IIC
VLSTALLAGALAVDNRSSLRLLVSQPICGGVLAGLVLGDPRSGFVAGALLQMLFLGWTNIRGMRSLDLPLGGVTAAAVFILARRAAGVERVAPGLYLLLSLAAALLVSAVGRAAYRFWESRSYFLTTRALALIEEGRFGLAAALHVSTVALHFACGFALVALAALVGAPLVAGVSARMPALWGQALVSMRVLIPCIGAGSLLVLNLTRLRLFLFLAGFLVVYLVSIFGG